MGPESLDRGVGAVQREVTVDVSAERAFWAFAELDRIKPREHNLLAVPIEKTVLEPRAGGDVYDLGVDGSVCRWGRVLVFEPPRRIVLTWDIGPDWRIVEDQDRASEVEVTFTPAGDQRTRVTLEHRHLERHGQGWQAVRDGVEGPAGWPLYLDRYRDVVRAQRTAQAGGE